MALNLKKSAAARNNSLDNLTTLIGNSALLRIYDGAQPATPETAVGAQVKLAEFVLNAAGAFNAAASGAMTSKAIADVVGLAAGTAAWFRLLTSGATAVMDGTVGTSGADLTINNTSIAVGQTLSIANGAITITAGNA